MDTALTPPPTTTTATTTTTLATAGPAPRALAATAAQAKAYADASKAANTRRAYRADWADFAAWCDHQGQAALPAAPATLALYLTDRAEDCKAATLGRRLVTIARAHKAAGYDTPTTAPAVRAVWAGIRRVKGTAQQGKAAAVTDDVRAMVAGLPDTLRGHRDRALLLLGFAGAFRRSELVALDVGDVADTRAGLVVTLRRSKTDQEGAGRTVGIPYGAYLESCPVRAYRAWREASGIVQGPLFRAVDWQGMLSAGPLSDKGVARIVKRRAKAAGLDPAKYSGHSLRAGLATAAAAAGKSERAIMAQTGHKSIPMVRRYIRAGDLFRENAAAGLGL